MLVRSAAAICERFRRQRQFHSQPGLMLGPAPGRYRGGRIAKSAVCFGKRTYRDKSLEGESESERELIMKLLLEKFLNEKAKS